MSWRRVASLPRWEVTHRLGKATIVLPTGFELGEAVETTRVGDQYARFMQRDGTEVDCAQYAEQMEKTCRTF